MKQVLKTFYKNTIDLIKDLFGLLLFFGVIFLLIFAVVTIPSLIINGRLPKSSDFPADLNDNSNCEGPAYMGDNCH